MEYLSKLMIIKSVEGLFDLIAWCLENTLTLFTLGMAFVILYQAKAARRIGQQKLFVDLVEGLNSIDVYDSHDGFVKANPCKNQQLQVITRMHNHLDAVFEAMLRECEPWFCLPVSMTKRKILARLERTVKRKRETHAVRLFRWYCLVKDYYIEILIDRNKYEIPYHKKDPHRCRNEQLCDIYIALEKWDKEANTQVGH